MKRVALIAFAALAASTGVASAYDYYGYGYGYGSGYRGDRIDRRQDRQYWRIYRANRAGELTWRERQRLYEEQAHIARMERWAKRDGYISRSEARRIDDAQDAARRHIRRESRDDQYRW